MCCTSCRCVFFFFSSRRRHTRCGRDWSSDVCSSDLKRREAREWYCPRSPKAFAVSCPSIGARLSRAFTRASTRRPGVSTRTRSEERRVGKECRSRWAPDNEKEKRRKQTVDRRDGTKE